MTIELRDLTLVIIGASSLTIGFIWNEFVKRTYEDIGKIFVPNNKAFSFLIYTIIITIFILLFIIFLTYVFLDKEDVRQECEKQTHNVFNKRNRKSKQKKKRNNFNPWK